MPCRPVDQVFERLCVSSKCDLPERGHRKESAERIECLLLEYAVLFTEVHPQPRLQRIQQRHIGVEEMIHGCDVVGKQAAALQIGPRNVIEVASGDLRPEIDVTGGLLDRLESDSLVLDEFHCNLRDAPNENMRTCYLSNGIVAVLREPLRVERLRSLIVQDVLETMVPQEDDRIFEFLCDCRVIAIDDRVEIFLQECFEK